VKGLAAMAGLYSGKRTRTEHNLAENNDRNKRRNSGTGREQTMPGADSTVYRILCPSNVIGSVTLYPKYCILCLLECSSSRVTNKSAGCHKKKYSVWLLVCGSCQNISKLKMYFYICFKI
jgi:hypothetical protein